MTNKELAKAMGFKKVDDMFKAMGSSSKKISCVSKENRDKHIRSLIIEYVRLDTENLIKLLKGEEESKIYI